MGKSSIVYVIGLSLIIEIALANINERSMGSMDSYATYFGRIMAHNIALAAANVGASTGTIIMASLVGMALGGWLSGKIFDVSGSYDAAFINGVAWNALNMVIVWWLYRRWKSIKAYAPQTQTGSS